MTARTKLVAPLVAACLVLCAVAQAADATPLPAWGPVAVTGPTVLPPVQSEVQALYVDAASGTFTLSFEGATTAPIAFNATADSVEASLNSLSTIGGAGGSVTVAGGPGAPGAKQPYAITFGGSLANKDVATIITASTALAGGETQSASIATEVPGGAGTVTLALYLQNIGGGPSNGTTTYEVTLPSGVTTAGIPISTGWQSCTPPTSGQSHVTCTLTSSVIADETAPVIDIPITAAPGAGSGRILTKVIGGGAPSVEGGFDLQIGTTPAPAGIEYFDAGAYDEEGKAAQQAGAHPFSATTAFFVNTKRSPRGKVVPSGDAKDIRVDLPPGFTGDPTAVPQCPESTEEVYFCPLNTVVGVIKPIITLGFPEFGESGYIQPVYNSQAPVGAAANFRFNVLGADPLNASGSLRSSEDYGVTVASLNTPQVAEVYGAFFTFWGQPADASHDAARCTGKDSVHFFPERPIHCEAWSPPAQWSTPEHKAFITNGSDCAEQARSAPVTFLHMTFWQPGTNEDTRGSLIPPVTGCSQLHFEPAFTFRPSSTQGSSGVGASAHLHLDQAGLTDPSRLAAPDLKQSVVKLPQGFDVNPGQADGLKACSEAQVGFVGEGALPNPTRFNEAPVSCPDASKLGTVEAHTPLLEEPLKGTIYLATQEENPFHSLIALYLVIESERYGITLKLPGKVETDAAAAGQVTATFDYVPQQPVEDLILNFRGGDARSEFATPEVCGIYTTTGTWTPWSAPESDPPAQTSDSFTVSGGCAGSASSRPFQPSFEGGSVSPLAGAYTPLVIKVARKDGEQELKSLDFTLPPGETGKLAGIPYCSDSAIAGAATKTGKQELAGPSCLSASQIGTVDTAAGVGDGLVHVGGKVYLAGPYEGAPLSAVVITPAVAGPFDLGDVVIRSPLFVNPETAQITAKSDPIPTILRGIPLKIRSVAINIDRSGFSLNPTNCEAMSISATVGSSDGASATPTNRFQVGNCEGLAFKPKLQLSLNGATKHAGHPALKAVVTYPKEGAYANIARAQVNLPHSEFIDQGNLNKTCTKPVLLAGNCPAKSVYGKAKAWTPLLEKPLEGNVYLVGGYGYKLPALVAELNGQIRVLLVGKVDSGPNKGIRNTFEAVPDAPVEKFVLEMKGGKKYGLLENSENLCAKAQKGIARFSAQNGRVDQFKPVVQNDCKKGKGKKGGKGKKSAGRGTAQSLAASALERFRLGL